MQETPPEASATDRQQQRNRTVGFIVACVAIGMVGMAYAAVPLYQLFCQVTGFGGTTQVAAAPSGKVLERTIRVRFDANVDPGFPWGFAPEEKVVTLPIGEQKLLFYRATNTTDRRLVGTSTYNVTPAIAGRYFNKIQCFCFTEQVLEPGQSVDMPVIFFIDPAIMDDWQSRRITEITLSYTFYEVENPTGDGQQVAARQDAGIPG